MDTKDKIECLIGETKRGGIHAGQLKAIRVLQVSASIQQILDRIIDPVQIDLLILEVRKYSSVATAQFEDSIPVGEKRGNFFALGVQVLPDSLSGQIIALFECFR